MKRPSASPLPCGKGRKRGEVYPEITIPVYAAAMPDENEMVYELLGSVNCRYPL
jgi:hypothetical protein